MEEIIKAIKNQNGNTKFSNNELLWYVVAKIDKLQDKIDRKVDYKLFYWIVGGISTLTFGGLSFLFRYAFGG